MPRLNLCRLFLLLPLFYLCAIGLWIFLPSPPIPPLHRSAHIQSTLLSGHPLITIHSSSLDNLSTPPSPDLYADRSDTAFLAITYSLQPSRSTNSLTLLIDDDTRLNLTDYALQPPPYLSPTPLTAHVRAGSTDHIINLPWFHPPDAILFHHHMHGFPADVAFRVLVPEAGTVEIWKDSPAWNQREFFRGLRSDPEAFFGRVTMEDRKAGMFLRVRGVPMVGAEMGGLVFEDVKGGLTSRTFGVRLWLLGPLGPVPTIVMFLVGFVILPALAWALPKLALVVGLYATIVVVWWLLVGRPSLAAWSRGSILLSPLYALLGMLRLRSKDKMSSSGRRKGQGMVLSLIGPAEGSDDDDDERSFYLRGNGGHPGTFGNRLDQMLKGVRVRTKSADIEERRLEQRNPEKFG